MHVQVLGNGAGGPFQGRHYSAQVVKVDNHLFLVDCGEGVQQQIYRYGVKVDRFRQIFISHLHGDHVYGLAGLLTSYCIRQRSLPLEIFSPPGLQEMLETVFRLSGVIPPFPIVYHAVDPAAHRKVFENSRVSVWTVPLHHRMPCTGWLFREKQRPRNMRKEKIDEYGIPVSRIPAIKAGADLLLDDGRTIPNEELTLAPAAPRSYAYCSDTAFSESVAAAVQGVDLLYHEATFTRAHEMEAGLSFHSTAAQAARVAALAGAGRLLLGHFSARYRDLQVFLDEARPVFPETYLSEEGEEYSV